MRIRFYIFLILLISASCPAQSLAPSVFNAAGGEGQVASPEGRVTVYYNIGEPVYDDIKDNNDRIRLTQGFLQPDVIGNGVLTVYSFTSGMTCTNSNDASVVLTVSGMSPPFLLKWFKNGIQLTDTGSTLLNLSPGSYSFVVTDKKRNVRSSAIEIPNSRENCRIVIHNGLSPNEDGHNDFFHIEYIGDYAGNSVSIFNRWGDQVWEGKEYDNKNVVWKGADKNGNELAPGTYYYIVEVEGKKSTGWVELIK